MSLSQIVSPALLVEEHYGNPAGTLMPEEERYVLDAVESRRNEFACARSCARRALERLGRPQRAILVGEGRQPIWPYSVVGSLTHCTGYCAAAIAERRSMRAIGVDAESNTPLADAEFRRIRAEEERSHLAELPDISGLSWSVLLFSMKESLFKAWFPLVKRPLPFRLAAARIDPEAHTFVLHIHHPCADDVVFPKLARGRYTWTKTHVYSAVEVPEP